MVVAAEGTKEKEGGQAAVLILSDTLRPGARELVGPPLELRGEAGSPGRLPWEVAGPAEPRRSQIPAGEPGAGDGGLAVMVVTADSPVPPGVIAEIVALDGFESGRAVSV